MYSCPRYLKSANGILSDHNLSAPRDTGTRFAERRAAPRYALSAAIEVLEPITSAQITGRTFEISLKGCCIRASRPLRVNTVIQLIIRRENCTFEAWGRVAHMRQDGLGMGIAFFQAQPEHERIMIAWISELNLRSPQ